MESNLIEIKRFLKENKKFIAIGSILIAILFTIALVFLDMNKEETLEGQEDFDFAPAEVMNEAQPAYFQFYLETEDGTAYGNSSIFSQYFNLKTVKEKAQRETKVDIETVEEEILLQELSEEISIINVTRNDSSYLFTVSFNLGNEQNNLKLSKYYFDLLLEDEMGLLEDKNVYVFAEPTISKINKENLDMENAVEGESKLTDNIIFNILKNSIIGLILGVVFTIGLALLKVIYGKKLDYSFAYDVTENDEFILYDKKLENEKIVSQFVAAPLGGPKAIVSEERLGTLSQKIISENKSVTFNNQEKEKTLLIDLRSLAEMDITDNISEVIIVISPHTTTRKWYEIQQQLADINDLNTKVIQINA